MVVRFPGIGVWRSPVAHLLWEQGAGGSNPLTPTILTLHREDTRPRAFGPSAPQPPEICSKSALQVASVIGLHMFYICLPDTADPRGPKGK